jgi:beta-galactosidase
MQARVGVSRALMNGNIPWEHVTPTDLDAGLAPRYKVIYLPAQLAISQNLLGKLLNYAEAGGRVVMDAPGALYDEHGLALPTAGGTVFERLFGAELSDVQYSNNVPRILDGRKMQGFISELRPTRAKVLRQFQTGEAALTEHSVGKGSAILIAWDASYSVFKPGNPGLEAALRSAAMGPLQSPYSCDNAVVYRIASPQADHYFFINDGPPTRARLAFRNYKYLSATDPVTGEQIPLDAPVDLEAYSGRWLRFQKR